MIAAGRRHGTVGNPRGRFCRRGIQKRDGANANAKKFPQESFGCYVHGLPFRADIKPAKSILSKIVKQKMPPESHRSPHSCVFLVVAPRLDIHLQPRKGATSIKVASLRETNRIL